MKVQRPDWGNLYRDEYATSGWGESLTRRPKAATVKVKKKKRTKKVKEEDPVEPQIYKIE